MDCAGYNVQRCRPFEGEPGTGRKRYSNVPVLVFVEITRVQRDLYSTTSLSRSHRILQLLDVNTRFEFRYISNFERAHNTLHIIMQQSAFFGTTSASGIPQH